MAIAEELPEHGHGHGHAPQPDHRRLREATWISAAAMVGETVVSGLSGTLGVDAVHRLGDTAGFGLQAYAAGNGVEQAKQTRLRRAAAMIICIGAVVVGAKAGIDWAEGKTEPVEPIVPITALIGGGANWWVMRRLGEHADHGGAHADGWRHAAGDLACSGITLAATTASAAGLESADPAGALVAATVTVIMNYPTHGRMAG